MKKLFSLFIAITISTSSFAGLTCAPGAIEVLGKKLTPYWAKEYTGSDLAADFLKSIEEQIPLKKVPLAIFDLGFEEDHIQVERDIKVPFQRNGQRRIRANHGTSVANLLTGPRPIRMTNYADLMSLEAITFGSYYRYAFNRYERNNFYPKVISNSLGWSDPSMPELTRDAYDRGISWFLAAGNDFPTPVRTLEINSKAMLVASYSPSGLTDLESQIHPDLLVLAPANKELKTIDGYGKVHHFGASSGATPLVAAAAIDILALYPELQVEHIKALINTTALPSAENKLGMDQMPGLLNHYGAVMAAFNLRKKCGADLKCIDTTLANGEGFASKSLNIIPCNDLLKLSCENKSAVLSNKLKAMRIGVLLGHPNHRRAQAKELSCVYQHLGFTKNAEYYRFLSQEKLPLQEMQEQAIKALENDIFQASYYRYGPLYKSDYREFLKSFSGLGDYQRKWHLALRKEHLSGQKY